VNEASFGAVESADQSGVLVCSSYEGVRAMIDGYMCWIDVDAPNHLRSWRP
jgi:hypothetical protein